MGGLMAPLDSTAARSELTRHPYRIKLNRLRVQSRFETSVHDCTVMVPRIAELPDLNDLLELVASQLRWRESCLNRHDVYTRIQLPLTVWKGTWFGLGLLCQQQDGHR